MNIFWGYVILIMGIIIGLLIASFFKSKTIKSLEKKISYYEEILNKGFPEDPAKEGIHGN